MPGTRYDPVVRWVAVVASSALLCQSGCSALMAANINHNSRGSSCMDDPAFPAIDLVGGSLGAIALVYTGVADESPGWLAIPGVFMLSGLVASLTVYACRHPDGEAPRAPAKPYTYMAPPPDNATPEESDVRDATLEERGMSSAPVPAPSQLETEPVAPEATPVPAPVPAPVPCRIHPLTRCPDGSSCVLTEGETGVCRPDSEVAKPRTTLPP